MGETGGAGMLDLILGDGWDDGLRDDEWGGNLVAFSVSLWLLLLRRSTRRLRCRSVFVPARESAGKLCLLNGFQPLSSCMTDRFL